MGLYERWTSSDDSKIGVHTFGCALREMSRSAVTRTQVINAFTLTGDDVTELDAIRSKYVGLATAAEKTDYVILLHDVMILAEQGFYNRATCADRLGFT